MFSMLVVLVPLLLAAPPQLTSGPPPVKMGLWESSINNGMGSGTKVHVCVTAESYQEAFSRMPPGCTMSNTVRGRTHVSSDIACKMHDSTSSGHFDVDFPDAESGHAVMTLNMMIQGHPMAMTIKTDSHFVSSDCGSVLPGKPQIIQ